VLIVCPSCRHSIRVVDLRPGRFTPRCPRCERVFQLTVPEERGRTPVITPLEASVFAEPVAMPIVDGPPAEIAELDWPVPAGSLSRGGLLPHALPRGAPRLLGKYVMLKLLGKGPRGPAFLARALGLGPPDVLKLGEPARWADPVFRAWFTREAFTAAQLGHPNLVAIRELGTDRGFSHAAVEYVEGLSVTELLSERSRLEPYQAAVVILQAARGLRAAHEQGLWHRDVKPQNLRLDSFGLVKVDDLGLEMTPSLAAALGARQSKGSGQTDGSSSVASIARQRSDRAGADPVIAMVGTPAYVAPEQAADPLAIDGRADIYALGGTFYSALTGRPPYPGETAVELIRQHQEDSLVPPGEFVSLLPRSLADIIKTMMAKRPEERYPNMKVVVDVLEEALGLKSESARAALENARQEVQQAAATLEASAARKLRFRIVALGLGIWATFVLLLLNLRVVSAALGVLGLGALTGLAVLFSSAITHRSELLSKVSQAVLGGGFRSWLIAATIPVVAAAALWIWGGFLPSFVLCCAAAVAAAFHHSLDQPVAAEREAALARLRDCLKRLRARGHEEVVLQDLVANHGGRGWQALFERLFGRRALPATLARREHDGIGGRSRSVSLREALLTLLEKRLEARRDQHHQRLLEAVEEGRLEAAGVNLLTVRRKARRISKALVVTAAEWRDEQRLLAPVERSLASATRPLVQRLQVAALRPEPVLEPHEVQTRPLFRRLDLAASLVLGRGLRFLLGVVLLGLFAFWLDAKGILTGRQVRDQAVEIYQVAHRAATAADPGILRELRWDLSVEWKRLLEPVDVPWLRESLGMQIPGANLAASGVLLLVSVLSGRKLTGLLALLGATLALFGPRWGLVITALNDRLDGYGQARAVGLLLLIAGFFIPRRRPTS